MSKHLEEICREFDSQLKSQAPHVATLAWERPCATPLETLLKESRKLQEISDTQRRQGVQGVIKIGLAVLENFPRNIFWDFDALFFFLARQTSESIYSDILEKMLLLQKSFGQTSVIRFRYAHDFLYGFDWIRWLQKDPKQRSHVGPYDLIFLNALQERAKELVALIAKNDSKYGQIEPQAFRNPFIFHREPKEEALLLRKLSKKEQIPCQAWHREFHFDANFDYNAARIACAKELKLLKESSE